MPPHSPHSAKSRQSQIVWYVLLLVLCLLPGRRLVAQEDGEDMRLPGGQMLRGTVTAVHGSALTLKDLSGTLYQITATDNTRVVRARQTAKFADIKVGDGLGAGGVLDAPSKTLHAAFVAVIDADEVRRAQAEFGKTYIAGKITAIDLDALRLTILRIDNVKQVIAVDESTSFRRGGRDGGFGSGTPAAGGDTTRKSDAPAGESITLADIKVGDSVSGRGALKGGIFLPSELHISNSNHVHHNAGDTAASGRP